MKKKRLCLIGIVTVLTVLLLTPSVAMAENPVTFIASGTASVDDFGVSRYTGPVEHVRNELVLSSPVIGLEFEGWDEADGASFITIHDGLLIWLPRHDGTFEGSLQGTFVIEKENGELEGNIWGNIRGKIILDPVSKSVSDYGTFTSTGGDGIFAKTKIQGTWNADLLLDEIVGTYIGEIVLIGRVISHSKRE
ncbi:hypothetical protein ACFLV0_07600 [Chloroflexota bacterium]